MLVEITYLVESKGTYSADNKLFNPMFKTYR